MPLDRTRTRASRSSPRKRSAAPQSALSRANTAAMASEYNITASEEEGVHDEQSTVSRDEEGEDDEDGDGDGGATTLTIGSDGRIAAQGSDEIDYTTRALLGVLDRVPTAAHARLVADCEVRQFWRASPIVGTSMQSRECTRGVL
jgi:hypothetical protein